MKFNKLMIFSIILIAMLTLGVVSATDSDSISDIGDSEDISIDGSSFENDNTLAIDEDSVIAEGDGESELLDYDYDVDVSNEVYPWNSIISLSMPDDANGTFNISFDDNESKTIPEAHLFTIFNTKKINFLDYNDSALEYGKEHKLNLKYFNDSKYFGFDYNFTFMLNYIKFEVPEDISIMESVYQNLIVSIPSDGIGKAAFFLDGEQIGYAQPFIVNGNCAQVKFIKNDLFDENDFKWLGKHNYEFRYFDGNYDNASQKGTIDVVFYELICPDVIVKGSDFNEDITVNLPFDAFGSLKLIADGKELTPKQTFYRDDLTTYVFNLSSLDCKEYDAALVYSGDGHYPAFNRTVSFNLDYLVEIYPDSYTLNKSVSDELYLELPIEFPEGKTFKLTVDGLDDPFTEIYSREEYNTVARFDISELYAGTYDAKVVFEGDSQFPAKTVDLTLNKRYAIHFNNWHDIFEDTYVTLKLPDNATGTLKVWDNYTKFNASIPLNQPEGNYPGGNYNYTISVSNGFKLVNCTIPNTVLGLTDSETNYLVVKYDGNDYFVIDSFYDDGDSDPSYISISPRMNLPIVYAGKDANFTFEMPSDAKGRLLVQIEGKTYYNGTLKNGKATFKLPTTKVGDFYFYYEYTGDAKYGSSRTIRDTSTFTVKGKMPNINLTMPTYLVKNCYNTIKFTFPGTSFNGNLRLRLDYGNYRYEYKNVSIVKGVGTLKILPKYQGKVRIFYDYAYKHYAAHWECFGDFKVYKLTSKNVTKYYTDSKKLNVAIVDNHNKAVPNGQVIYFYYKGKKIGNATTKNGVASFKLNYKPGTYIIKVYYKGTYVNRKVIIKPILTFKAVKVKRSAKKLVLTASLKKVNGKYLKGKIITFKFNGKTYKAKTNSKGVAKYTIKRAVLKKLKVGKKIKIQATYLKNTVKRTAKVYR
ncbi:MAG: Ig-like domain repeat protein [Methanobrevibacter sp.]|nr:Ig-like domain repeat protein [Methanobrevibacter sp.]